MSITIQHFNNTNVREPASVSIVRQYEVSSNDARLTVERFSVSNRAVPAFVPKIISVDDKNAEYAKIVSTYTSMGYSTNSFETLNDYKNILPQNTTDMFFVITRDKDMQAWYGFVPWITIEANTYTAPSNFLDRKEQLESQYYHCYNSLHICKIVSAVLDTIVSVGLGYGATNWLDFIKTTGAYVLLTPTKELGLTLGRSLNNMFGFNYAMVGSLSGYKRIAIDWDVVTQTIIGLMPIPSYVIYTITDCVFFPFKTLLFTTSSIPVRAMALQVDYNGSSDNNNSLSILTDFLIQIQDVDTIYNSFDYVPQSLDRYVILRGTERITRIDFTILLMTDDGVICQMYLDPYQSISIRLSFK